MRFISIIPLHLFAILSLVFTPFSAYAQSSADYIDNANRFDQLTKQTILIGKMPRLTDEPAARLIQSLSDSPRYLGTTKYTSENLGELMTLCARSNRIVMSYLMFDVNVRSERSSAPGSGSATGAQVKRLISRNAHQFHHELRYLHPFLLNCIARQIPLMNQYTENLQPEQLTNMRRAGLTRARQSLHKSYFGFLQILEAPGLNNLYRDRLSRSLAKSGIAFSSAFRPLDRNRILNLLESDRFQSLPNDQSWVQGIRGAMLMTICSGLCRF